MRRLLALLALLFVIGSTAAAQCGPSGIRSTATGGGYFFVTINGVRTSQHTTERGAALAALDTLAARWRRDSLAGFRVPRDSITWDHGDYSVWLRRCAPPAPVPPPVDSTPPIVPPPPPPPPAGDVTAPVAVAKVTCYGPQWPECEFDGRASSDNVGIVSYRWLGGPVDGRTQVRFETQIPPGTYTVTLIVTDAAGNQDPADVTYTQVGGAPPDTAVTPPPVVPPPPPPVVTPPAGGSTLIPATSLATWRAMRDANHPLWQAATATCAMTGTSGELYGEDGTFCAIVAATNSDATAAAKAIAKLRGYSPAAKPDWRRENFIHAMLAMDVLRPWLTAADWSALTTTFNAWAAVTLNPGDSDAITGEGCGAMLWDRLNGRTPTQTAVLNTLAQYVQKAAGGIWIESSAYNDGTVQLFAMCNLATRTATGQDVVPGASAFLADLGTAETFTLTPDLNGSFQFVDDQYPRQFTGRLYRRGGALQASGSPVALATWDALVARYWPFAAPQLMSHAMWAAQGTTARATIPAQATHVASGMGFLFRRDGAAASLLMATNYTGVDHSNAACKFDAQVYDGGWLVTHPIGYLGFMEMDLSCNAPLYAGLSYFDDSRMTWADSGNGWAAIAGRVTGRFHFLTYPQNAPDFLKIGSRVQVQATIAGKQVLIVRDSVDMVDPRTLPGFVQYVESSTYQWQSRVAAADGKFWALWHMPGKPAEPAPGQLTWTAPNGQAVTLWSFANGALQTAVFDETTLFGQAVNAAEKKWQARVHTDAPVLFSVLAPTGMPVLRNLDSITLGGASGVTFTITSAGVTVR